MTIFTQKWSNIIHIKWSLLSVCGSQKSLVSACTQKCHECLCAFKNDDHADTASRIAEMPVVLMILRCVVRCGIPSLPRGAGSSSCWGLSLGVAWAKGLSPGVDVSSDVGRA